MTTMSTSALYLCVDCGGTKTSAVICNSAAEIVGRALGGPSNFSYLGLQPFLNVLKSTVEKALSNVSSNSPVPIDLSVASRFASAWVAVSGVDSPSDKRILTSSLSLLFSIPEGNRLQVTNDAHLLASPLQVHQELKSAVAVIAGTGSVVISFARDDNTEDRSAPLKEMARAGGWGWILGDVGSGFEVGREAIREILAREDRASVNGPAQNVQETPLSAEKTTLQSRIFSHFGISSAPDIFSFIYAPDPLSPTTSSAISSPASGPANSTVPSQAIFLVPREQRLSQLTPLVFRSAFEDGDELALTVLKRCAGALADVIAMLLTSASDPPGMRPNAVEASSSVLCLGGSLVGIKNYRDLVLDQLKSLGHVFAAVEFVGGGDVAAAGAIGLATSGNLGAS